MYNRLLVLVKDYPDVQQVFLNLQQASQQNHLPAFQRATSAFGRQQNDGKPGDYAGARGQGHRRGCRHRHGQKA